MYNDNDEAICDGCGCVIRGTEERPANVWSTCDDQGKSVHLCDRCNEKQCGECGASLYKKGAKSYIADDGRYYCADSSLCGPDEEEGV